MTLKGINFLVIKETGEEETLKEICNFSLFFFFFFFGVCVGGEWCSEAGRDPAIFRAHL